MKSLSALFVTAALSAASLTVVGPAAAADEDTTPPVVDTLSAPQAVHPVPLDGDVSISYAWTGHDREGSEPLTYDLRAGWSSTLPDDATWPVVVTNTVDTAWTAVRRWYDPDSCVEVRAHDTAGNVSGWSDPVCTVIDNGPPTADVLIDHAHWHGLATNVHDALAATPVSYTYRGQDDDQVASYDVQARVALPGATYGPWLSPSAWQGTTATTVSMHVRAGGSICFRVRARDRSGYVGDYSPQWCMYVPYDDRAFRIRDGAQRVRVERALGHTAAFLHRSRSLMLRRHVHAQEIWIRVLRPRRASVCLGVRLGVRHPRYRGCFLESESGAVWQGYYFRPGSHGRLRIRGDRRSIDAVAIIPVSRGPVQRVIPRG